MVLKKESLCGGANLEYKQSKDPRFFSNMSGKTFNITQEQRNSNYFDDVVESDHDIFRKQRPLLTLRKVGPKHEKEVSKGIFNQKLLLDCKACKKFRPRVSRP